MTFPREPELQPIPSADPATGPQYATGLTVIDRKFIKKFREQIHALGALWIIFGVLATGIVALAVSSKDPAFPDLSETFRLLFLGWIASLGVAWFLFGVLTCLKHLWAVYAGLVLTYFSLVGQVLNLNVCAGILAVLVILQAHRVIGWANQMRAAGVPLTATPSDGKTSPSSDSKPREDDGRRQ